MHEVVIIVLSFELFKTKFTAHSPKYNFVTEGQQLNHEKQLKMR